MITNYDYTIACPHCAERFQCVDTDKPRVQREAALMFADHMCAEHPENLDARMMKFISDRVSSETKMEATP